MWIEDHCIVIACVILICNQLVTINCGYAQLIEQKYIFIACDWLENWMITKEIWYGKHLRARIVNTSAWAHSLARRSPQPREGTVPLTTPVSVCCPCSPGSIPQHTCGGQGWVTHMHDICTCANQDCWRSLVLTMDQIFVLNTMGCEHD